MKYHNRKTRVFGIMFDSKHEAERYLVLRDMERDGKISDLRLQVKFELIPPFKIGGKAYRSANYIADFVYTKNGKQIVEDAKGVRTSVYQLKKKLMAWRHGIEIREV